MRTTVHAFLIAVTAALLGGADASAHHSFAAEFDAQKPVTLKGTVVKWEMINPHGWITLAVTGPDGKVVIRVPPNTTSAYFRTCWRPTITGTSVKYVKTAGGSTSIGIIAPNSTPSPFNCPGM